MIKNKDWVVVKTPTKAVPYILLIKYINKYPDIIVKTLIKKVVEEPFRISLKIDNLFLFNNKILYWIRIYFFKIKFYNLIKNAYKQTA